MIFPPTTPQTQWQTSQPHRRGGEDVGDLSTVRRTLGRVGEQTGRLIPLAPCPVEGCPVGVAYPGFRLPRQITCSDAAEMPTSLWAVTLSVTGTNPFIKALATPTPTSPFSAYFTLEMAPGGPPGHRRKSLYTGMTVDPVHFRSLPQKGGRASPPIKGMVFRPTAPHTRWASDPTETARFGLTRARRRER